MVLSHCTGFLLNPLQPIDDNQSHPQFKSAPHFYLTVEGPPGQFTPSEREISSESKTLLFALSRSELKKKKIHVKLLLFSLLLNVNGP